MWLLGVISSWCRCCRWRLLSCFWPVTPFRVTMNRISCHCSIFLFLHVDGLWFQNRASPCIQHLCRERVFHPCLKVEQPPLNSGGVLRHSLLYLPLTMQFFHHYPGHFAVITPKLTWPQWHTSKSGGTTSHPLVALWLIMFIPQGTYSKSTTH